MTNIEAAKTIRKILERNKNETSFYCYGIMLDKNEIAALHKAVKTQTKEHTRSFVCNQTKEIDRW